MSDVQKQFLRDFELGIPIAELMVVHGIGKSAAYDLVKRARTVGVEAAVAVKSRAPHHRPGQLPAIVVERVLELRTKYPQRGPKKLRYFYVAAHGEVGAPSTSSIFNILAREGLTKRPYRQAYFPPDSEVQAAAVAPNDVWAVDHKGPMEKLARVEPLNVLDVATRFWIGCDPLAEKTYLGTRTAFERWFAEFGLPRVIRVDCGGIWVTLRSPSRLTQLSAWWLALGIRVEVAPSCRRNPHIERLHGTMEREMHHATDDVRAHFQRHQRIYNEERPHESLGMVTPSMKYQSSPCVVVERPHLIRSGGHERKVQDTGFISFRGNTVFVSEGLVGRTVGLYQTHPDRWRVDYYEQLIGFLNAKTWKLEH